MNQILPIFCVGFVLVVVLIWWLVGRFLKPGPSRTLVRLAAIVAVIAVVVLIRPRLLPMPSMGQSGSGDQPIPPNTTPTDSAIVQSGSLMLTVSATGHLEPATIVDLSFDQAAPVIDILVEPGQRVSTGDALARQDSTDAQAALSSAQLALREAQVNYNDLVNPPREVDIAVAEAAINVAYASLASASTGADPNDVEAARIEAELARNQLWQQQLSRDLRLEVAPEFRGSDGGAQAEEVRLNADVQSAERGVEIADVEYQDARNTSADIGAISSANAQVVQAQVELDRLISGPTEAERRRAEIDVQNAELEVQRAENQLDQTTLIAPFTGIVAAEYLTVGEVPPEGAALTILEAGVFTLDLSIDETDVVNVQVGQRVEIIVDALPNQTFTGMITKLEIAPSVEGQLVTYTATTTLDATSAPIRPGMSATARIILNEIENALIVPNRFLRVTPGTQQVSVVVRSAEGTYQEVPVQIGARNQTSSQILSGLEVGQEIVLLPQPQSQQPAPPIGGPPPGGGGFFGGGPGGGG